MSVNRIATLCVRRCRLAAVLAIVAGTIAWDAPRLARGALPTLIYVGAADCAPCRTWQNDEEARFRASPQFAKVIYREVKSPTLRGLLGDEYWPADLREFRDRLDRHVGAPMWLVVEEREILRKGFGASQWRNDIVPFIKAVTR